MLAETGTFGCLRPPDLRPQIMTALGCLWRGRDSELVALF